MIKERLFEPEAKANASQLLAEESIDVSIKLCALSVGASSDAGTLEASTLVTPGPRGGSLRMTSSIAQR